MPDTPEPAAILRAPWTPEQVHALNAYQSGSGMHPFTCGRDHGGQAVALIAHTDGWHCSAPPCDYRQDWALAFMADPSAWPGTRRLRGLLEHVGTDAAGRDIIVDGKVVDAWAGRERSERTDIGTEFVQQADHPDTALVRVAIDPNIRVHGNLTRAGLEDADGPLTAGQDVTVYEPETGLTGPGRVVRIDNTRQLVYLAVQWSALRAVPGPDPALQDRVARALREHGMVHLGDDAPGDEYDCCARAVLAELAPELDALTAARAGDGPWLRAYREDTLAARQAQQRAEAEVQRLGLMVDEYGTGARALSEELRETRAALAETRAIIVDLTDPDPCWYDHHGHCQAHGWTATDPACPHARAKALDAPAEGGPR